MSILPTELFFVLLHKLQYFAFKSPAMMTFFLESSSEYMSVIWRDIFGFLYAPTSLVLLFLIFRQIAVFVIDFVWIVSRLWISLLWIKIAVSPAGAFPLTSVLLVVYVVKFGSLNVLLKARFH